MKAIFLLNLDLKIKSGLFHAIHNRMKINRTQFDCKFYNVVIVDSKPLTVLKKIFGKKSYENYISDYSTVIDNIEYINIKLENTIIGKIAEKINFEEFQYKKIIKKIKNDINSCDLIVSHWGHPHGRIAYFIKKMYKKDYIVYYHGSDINCYTRDELSKRNKILQTMKEATNNIFIGKALMEKAIDIGYTGENITYTENGVNSDIFNIKKIERDKIVGFVGNLEFIKRAEFLPDIFEQIYKKDKDVEFIVIGDGTLKNKIQNECLSKNIPVDFTGKLDSDKVAEYMNKFNVLILPSRYESWGSVILEANACGAYVIASKAGGIPEVVGSYGSLVDNCDETIIEDCANQVMDVLKNKFYREDLEHRTKKFKWSEICKREYSLIKRQEAIHGDT